MGQGLPEGLAEFVPLLIEWLPVWPRFRLNDDDRSDLNVPVNSQEFWKISRFATADETDLLAASSELPASVTARTTDHNELARTFAAD
jgi:hypothetical protein